MTLLIPVFLAPIVSDNAIIEHNDVQTISLRNAGSATVNLQNGLWTLAPGETLHLNVVNNEDTMNVQNLSVSFDTSTGVSKKLQVLIMKKQPC